MKILLNYQSMISIGIVSKIMMFLLLDAIIGKKEKRKTGERKKETRKKAEGITSAFLNVSIRSRFRIRRITEGAL